MVFGRNKKLALQQAEFAQRMEHQAQQQRWKEQQLQEELRIQKEELRRREQQWRDEQRLIQIKEEERLAQLRREQEMWEKEEKMKIERRQRRLERLKLTTPEALRGLRDLIRQRYQLDMFIWSLRDARGPDRPIVIEKMEKADAVLLEIYSMVETWEENDQVWTEEEWALAQKIKERLQAGGKRWWENNHPWNEAQQRAPTF